MKSRFNRLWRDIFKGSLFPLFFIVLILLFYFYIKGSLSEKQDKLIGGIVFLMTAIFVTYWMQRIAGTILKWYGENIAIMTKTQLDDEFIPLFKHVARILIWAIGLIITLSHFGVNINALITTLGVGSLAIALAAQDTIANIIAGFLIMVDRPFRMGDEIQLPSGEKVRVLSIGVRRSRFLNQDKAIIIMPNLELSKSKIVNFTYGKEESIS
ncbi:mechanosensitive ion channel [Candidatus Pacearchaeota archaeon]|nr:mechanosensitive ion channel [Candidatus Pacearchaeota archaeon]